MASTLKQTEIPLAVCGHGGFVAINGRGTSFGLTLPCDLRHQIDYWGSLAWYIVYGLRSYVEGVFGNLKDSRPENVRLGTIQKNGLVWAQLFGALMSASYNLRMIRARHDRMEYGPIVHPLLSLDEESKTHYSFSPQEEALAGL